MNKGSFLVFYQAIALIKIYGDEFNIALKISRGRMPKDKGKGAVLLAGILMESYWK